MQKHEGLCCGDVVCYAYGLYFFLYMFIFFEVKKIFL